MYVLNKFFPNWRNISIHESSSGLDKVSKKLRNECSSYTESHYDTSIDFGSYSEGSSIFPLSYRSENLEQQTFKDSSFDVVLAQDVFEHIFNPDLAIREIARTLKPGGAAILTVPIVRKTHASRRRAALLNNEPVHKLPPQFHGNPISSDGSLVTIDWGYDIVSYLQHHSGLTFMMIHIDDIETGIRADLNEVLLGFKLLPPVL